MATLLAIVLFVGVSFVLANEPAWNGHIPSNAAVAALFTPYYVPPGAKSYDSDFPHINYKGDWTDKYSTGYIGKSLRTTSQSGGSFSFTFNGTGIEWFGNMDQYHGSVIISIDGMKYKEISGWSNNSRPLKQQRLFWTFELPPGRHTIKAVNSRNSVMDVDALVVTRGSPSTATPSLATRRSNQWALTQKGTTGVHAMQLAIVSSTHALIVDKVEHNPLSIDGHPAWAAVYNLENHSVKPLRMQSNSFCAGGTFLSNGTLINVGGNPVVASHTSAADFGDLDGLQAVRLFHPCDTSDATGCEIYENHHQLRMASPRWYNTVIRLSDGSAMIIGGSKKGGWMNNATVNNPTIEFYPPKNIHGSNGLPVHLPFLEKTLNSNLFPIAFSLPDGRVFMAANRDAIIYDWTTNETQNLPQIPNNVRVTYPMAGTSLLLPLTPENDYIAVILICGGSTLDDNQPSYEISSQDPATDQCFRLTLNEPGIALGWQVEYMPEARIMPDAVLLPTGKIVILNGGSTGISGYGNVLRQVGSSNADNPVLQPVLYDPNVHEGRRFSRDGMPSSSISRLYHSVATLTPKGNIMIAGSNPNLDRSEMKYGTEYRVEWLDPPYMTQERPRIVENIQQIGFEGTFNVKVELPSAGCNDMTAVLMDFGYVTHAVHANSRLVYLRYSSSQPGSLRVEGPPNAKIYPPGPGWLFIVCDDVPSEGLKVMIGDGQGPSIDLDAIENLRKTTVD
ncbi:copper radical oxidase [Crepidotus variabilis]|uniref:Copper radical oxidase n=1 Tax=Crepidotus variabilis TaxID=179855 RepID=A0A9P6EM20_9AGAR|nr:copper radical oxidase [Crepidotus variabilis]